MDPTAQFWRTAGLAGFLAGFALLLSQPVVLAGSVVICAVLLVWQWAFFAGTTAVDEHLSVEIEVPSTRYRQGETGVVTLRARCPESVPVETVVSVDSPLLASGPERLTVTLAAGDQKAAVTEQLEWSNVGTATFESPTVTVHSRDRLFTEQFERGDTPEVVIEPRVPRNVHVGEGGNSLGAAFGTHRTGEFGQGIDPATLREYLPGDDVGNIDWKATARHGDAYVREYEVESDRQMMLLFDHRGSTAVGPPGEQLSAYLREVALVLVSSAQSDSDPLGLYTVGDGGVTHEFRPATGTQQYRAIQTALRELEPTAARADSSASRVDVARRQVSSGVARSKSRLLADDQSQFGTQLQPFFADTQQYVDRIEDDPLLGAARRCVSEVSDGGQTLIFTSDHDRVQLRETVKVAAQFSEDVVLFLAPQALFDETAVSEFEGIYQAYLEFEGFRQELATIDGVTAYEVGPGELLDQILTANGR